MYKETIIQIYELALKIYALLFIGELRANSKKNENIINLCIKLTCFQLNTDQIFYSLSSSRERSKHMAITTYPVTGN